MGDYRGNGYLCNKSASYGIAARGGVVRQYFQYGNNHLLCPLNSHNMVPTTIVLTLLLVFTILVFYAPPHHL